MVQDRQVVVDNDHSELHLVVHQQLVHHHDHRQNALYPRHLIFFRIHIDMK